MHTAPNCVQPSEWVSLSGLLVEENIWEFCIIYAMPPSFSSNAFRDNLS